ncbi:MAG: hypothetical protein Q4A75_00175 [Peptostreptococcaceae bacterium]|nr:hypothetical protein [Peptostreptococcaceae bacterium]
MNDPIIEAFFVNSGTKDRRTLSIHRTWAGQGSVTQNSFTAEEIGRIFLKRQL